MTPYLADMNELLASKIATQTQLYMRLKLAPLKMKDTKVSSSANAGGHLRCEKTSSADSGRQAPEPRSMPTDHNHQRKAEEWQDVLVFNHNNRSDL